MHRKILTLVAFAPGCVVHSYDKYEEPPHTVVVVEQPINGAPVVFDADAFVFYDPFYQDDIWVFDAWVDDPEGPFDVIGVWADVYDEYAGGILVESLELYPTDDAFFWTSDWLGRTTYLDPFWPGYTVDLVAYDAWECFGWTTIWIDTY